MHVRALWAVGALLLAFASEGLQGLMTAAIGNAGIQAGAVGSAILAFLFLTVFNDEQERKQARKPKRKPKPPAQTRASRGSPGKTVSRASASPAKRPLP